MDKPATDNRSALTIGHLVQSGFNFQSTSGSKVNSIALLKALHSLGHDAFLLALQGNRTVIEFKDGWVEPKQKELGLSGNILFKLVEGIVRFLQSELNLPYSGLFDSFRFSEACLRYLSQCNVFHERYTVMGLGGTWAARKLSIPLILEVHADVINQEMPLHKSPLLGVQRYLAELTTRWCFRQAAKIVVVSRSVGESLQTYWRVPAEKIVIVPNAVDLELFDCAAACPEARAELGLTNEPIVMFTGSFQPWHGLDRLIEAFAKVISEIPAAKLVLVGDGVTVSRAGLEGQARQVGLENNIIFTGGVSYSKIPGLLSAADVAVAPYPDLSTELWFSPLKLFEYMAAAKAIVASRVGQTAEVLKDGLTGLLVKPGDTEALGKAIIRLLKEQDLRLRLGQNAHEEALKQHSWKFRAEKLEEIYRSVLPQTRLLP
jgi:glycosyltransferase involved in cell wall biosynthesis